MTNRKPDSLQNVGTTAEAEEWVVTYHIRAWGDERDRENDHIVTYESQEQAQRATRAKKGLIGTRLSWTALKRHLTITVDSEEDAEV